MHGSMFLRVSIRERVGGEKTVSILCKIRPIKHIAYSH